VTRRITDQELRHLRNHIDVAGLLEQLDVPWKIREGYFPFLCPRCSDFHTATDPRTNLARCFRCRENFNTIDLVMIVRDLSFLDAIRFLRRCPKTSSRAPPIDYRERTPIDYREHAQSAAPARVLARARRGREGAQRGRGHRCR